MGRFDYVKYDDKAQEIQMAFKTQFERLEAQANQDLKDSRWKSLLMTKLEEAYMCVGKAVRDDQIARNGSAPLQEERGDE